MTSGLPRSPDPFPVPLALTDKRFLARDRIFTMDLLGAFGRSDSAGGTDATDPGPERCSCPGCGGCANGRAVCHNPASADGLCRQCARKRGGGDDANGPVDVAFETGGCGVL